MTVKMTTVALGVAIISGIIGTTTMVEAQPVPGYVPPMTMAKAPAYADDTRGVFVPSHEQYRLRTGAELQDFVENERTGQDGTYTMAQLGKNGDAFEQELNRISGGYAGTSNELDNLGAEPLRRRPAPTAEPTTTNSFKKTADGGIEIASGNMKNRRSLDMNNATVRLREDRVSVRRALQRMMDQIGAGHWKVVWDLAKENATLPDMEVSIYAEEPFMDVLNALLARIQTRSGQPLHVIRYDNTQRLVLSDRSRPRQKDTSAVGVGELQGEVAVTETVLKESMVTLHYDEIPLVDALENVVNQAGRGEWRLRVYAGLDQVLKPAHIEEPFNIAMERLLHLFNLKYEIFPGGKLIVITNNNRFGLNGDQK